MKRIAQYCIIVIVMFAAVAAKSQTTPNTPRDGAYDHTDRDHQQPLPYPYLRESDVFWEKRIWRVIDVREKMNLPFKDPLEPFIKIMKDAINSGEITVYSSLNDSFNVPMTVAEVNKIGGGTDTISVVDSNGVENRKPVTHTLDYEKVTKFRIKEDWIFDKQTSMMIVRILGIAPILDVYDDQGNYRGEKVMFWAYYPDLRKTLAAHIVFNPKNDAIHLTWDDLFESRTFSSYIYKESNVYDRRIQDYATGIDGLLESDRVKTDIFNFEHDVWSF